MSHDATFPTTCRATVRYTRRKTCTAYDLNTPKSDQCQISPAVSPEILHPTVWRTWLFIACWDERWYQFFQPHLYMSLIRGWENIILWGLWSEMVEKEIYRHSLISYHKPDFDCGRSVGPVLIAGVHRKFWSCHGGAACPARRCFGQVNKVPTWGLPWPCVPQSGGVWRQTAARFDFCCSQHNFCWKWLHVLSSHGTVELLLAQPSPSSFRWR